MFDLMYGRVVLEGIGLTRSPSDLQRSVSNSPLIPFDGNLLIKDETGNPSGSFKLRGALRCVAEAADAGRTAVVTASSGNSGIAVTLAARAYGLTSATWVSKGITRHKLRGLKAVGATVVIAGSSFSETSRLASEYASDQEALFISPGASHSFIRGHQEIFTELIAQSSRPVRRIYVPCGGGGLLCAGAWAKRADTLGDAELVGVQAWSSRPVHDLIVGKDPALSRSFAAYAECISGDLETGALIREAISDVDRVELVTRDQLRRARAVLRSTCSIEAEVGAVCGLAAYLADDGRRPRHGSVALVTGRSSTVSAVPESLSA